MTLSFGLAGENDRLVKGDKDGLAEEFKDRLVCGDEDGLVDRDKDRLVEGDSKDARMD